MSLKKIARALAAELGRQDIGHPFILEPDLTLEYLDQNNVNFGALAQAALTAMLEGFEGDDLEAALDRLVTCGCADEEVAAVRQAARHRQLSAAAERARIVAWLRSNTDTYSHGTYARCREMASYWKSAADAIERGEV